MAFGQARSFVSLRKFDQGSGLTSYNITKIIQDQYGFLWIGTQEGLNCFDGYSFTPFTPGHSITGANVSGLTEDTLRREIWVSTTFGGICGIDTRTRRVVARLDTGARGEKLADKWVRSLAAGQGTLWIGMHRGLAAYDPQQKRYLPIENRRFPALSLDSVQVDKLLFDSFHRVWIFSSNMGILIIDGSTRQVLQHIPPEAFRFAPLKTTFEFWDAALSAHQLFVATSWGLRRIDFDAIHTPVIDTSTLAFLNHQEVLSCTVDNTGSLWVATQRGLYRTTPNGNQYTEVRDADFSASNWQSAIYQIFPDKQGDIWLGAQEGLAYFRNTERPLFSAYYQSSVPDVKIQHAYSLWAASDSVIYCGAQKGVYKVNRNDRSIVQIDSGTLCFLIFPLGDGRALFSNTNGLFILDRGKLEPAERLYPCLRSVRDNRFNSAVRISDSLILLGSQLQRGIYLWNTHCSRLFGPVGAGLLYDNVVNALYKTSQGQTWVLSEDRLFSWDPIHGCSPSLRLTHPTTKAPITILLDICRMGGRYWLAAYGTGLVEADDQMRVKSILAAPQGLCDNGVYRVLPFNDSLLLVTTNNGLSLFNIHTRAFRNYYQSDGLQSSSFEEFCASSLGGRIYAGGLNGFTIIDPASFSENKQAPGLYIDHIDVQTTTGNIDSGNIFLRHFVVPENSLQATIFFTGINYANPARTVFAYKIKELGGDWVSLGTAHSINLIGLAPGTYTLQIRSANEDGIWNTTPLSLTLVYLPKWYQTLYFKVLVLIVLGGLLYALYRYRVNQYQKQQKIRRDIASDLHDDLGATLNTIKILTHLAQRQPGIPGHLDKIESSVVTATLGLRDMLWVLEDPIDTLQDLLDRIRKFATPPSEAGDIQLETFVQEDIAYTTISKTVKRNLFLIAKESLNNSFKYAGCRHIQVRITLHHKKIRLSIIDDGKGFDTGSASSGNGLRNISYRAKEIRYHLVITSTPGVGTYVVVTQR